MAKLKLQMGTMNSQVEVVLSGFERIALNKGRVKWTVLFHWLLFIVMVARLSTDLCKMLQLDIPEFLAQLQLPAARLWELSWLPSIMGSMFAQLSLKRNNSSLLWQALLGNVVLGVGPVILGLYEQYPMVSDYFNKSQPSPVTNGYLFEIATCCWLAVSLQVHLLEVYFIQQLISAWATVKTKKST